MTDNMSFLVTINNSEPHVYIDGVELEGVTSAYSVAYSPSKPTEFNVHMCADLTPKDDNKHK